MRNTYGIDVPRERPSGDFGRWFDVWAWIIAFALLFAAPCVPQAPSGDAARAARARQGAAAPPADAPRRP